MAALRTILLDLDGTLVDSSEAIVDGVLALAAEAGLSPPSRAWARARIGGSPQDTWRLLGAPDPAALAEAFRSRYLPGLPARSLAMPGAAEALAALRDAGCALAVATTRQTASAQDTLAATGLLRWITVVVGGDQVARHKPDPEVLLAALSRLGRPVGGALMVGDTTADVGAARGAGLPCFAVLGGIHDEATLREAGADLILSGLAELPAAVERAGLRA